MLRSRGTFHACFKDYIKMCVCVCVPQFQPRVCVCFLCRVSTCGRWRGRRNDRFLKGWQLMKSRITECSIITSDSLFFFLSHTPGNFFFFFFGGGGCERSEETSHCSAHKDSSEGLFSLHTVASAAELRGSLLVTQDSLRWLLNIKQSPGFITCPFRCQRLHTSPCCLSPSPWNAEFI